MTLMRYGLARLSDLQTGQLKQIFYFILWAFNYKNRKSSMRLYIRDYFPMFSDYKQGKTYTSIAILDLLIHENIKNIIEIGVFRGGKAEFIIDGLLKKGAKAKDLSYVGFDLFSLAALNEIPPDECPYSEKIIEKIFQKRGIKYYLYSGFTSETLPKYVGDIKELKVPCPDFIFIDGGHSYETCCNDFKYSSEIFSINPKLIILFDDFHLDGVKKTVSEIDNKKFHITDILGRDVDFIGPIEGLNSLIEVRLGR